MPKFSASRQARDWVRIATPSDVEAGGPFPECLELDGLVSVKVKDILMFARLLFQTKSFPQEALSVHRFRTRRWYGDAKGEGLLRSKFGRAQVPAPRLYRLRPASSG